MTSRTHKYFKLGTALKYLKRHFDPIKGILHCRNNLMYPTLLGYDLTTHKAIVGFEIDKDGAFHGNMVRIDWDDNIKVYKSEIQVWATPYNWGDLLNSSNIQLQK